MFGTFKISMPATHQPQQVAPSFPAASSWVARQSNCRWRCRLLLSACGAATALLLLSGGTLFAQPVGAGISSGAATTDRAVDFVEEASRRYAIPASWIRAVMQAESGGDARALSAQGAMGLMQIMPGTWGELRLRYGLGTDPYDPRDNIMAGAAYLREMHDRFGERGFIAAYNAGPARYQEHVVTGKPLPAETISYVSVVASLISVSSGNRTAVDASAALPWTSAPLFVVRANAGSPASTLPVDASKKSLPVRQMEQASDAFKSQAEGLFAARPHRIGPR